MMLLNNIQSHFQNYLITGNKESIYPEIAQDEQFSAEKRLKVYFDAYRIRLHEILKLDFPKTHTLIGDEEFEKAFLTYLHEYPSSHFSVRAFGQHFSFFLQQFAPYKELPILAEMAQFEWMLAHTFDAKDESLISVDLLSQLSPEDWQNLQFKFHPAVISDVFYWDTPQLWQEIEKEAPQRAPIKQNVPIRWICYRKDIKTFFQSCTAVEDQMFMSISHNLPFVDICEALVALLPEEEIPLICAQTLFKWVNEGMISSMV